MKSEKKNIIITGGGTGGHITPLLAVAEEIKNIEPKAQIIYVGRKEDINSGFFHEQQLLMHSIYAGKLRRYFSLFTVIDFFKIGLGFVQSLFIVAKYKPKALFAKGGFVSVPVALAARIFRIPIITQESDVVLGLANKIISKWAKRVACGFEPQHYLDLKSDKLVFTGNPVRQEFILESQKTQPKTVKISKHQVNNDLPTLLVIGSSQGAHRINELLLPILSELLEKMNVVHISGRGDYNWLESEKGRLAVKLQKRYHLYSFILDELPSLIHKADLVISRSSASALSELSILKKASIIIPLSTAASNHQWHNAKIYEKKEAVVIVDERKASPQDLYEVIMNLISDEKMRHELGQKISYFSHPDAAKNLAKLVTNQIKDEKTQS